MAGIGLSLIATSLYSSVRSDITAYYKECLTETMELFEMSKDLLLEKGIYIRAPYVSNHKEIEFVKNIIISDIAEECIRNNSMNININDLKFNYFRILEDSYSILVTV